jgi:hypothetical protein
VLIFDSIRDGDGIVAFTADILMDFELPEMAIRLTISDYNRTMFPE